MVLSWPRKTYFGKPLAELDVHEIAFMWSVPERP